MALEFLQSVTGQSFYDLRDPAIRPALARTNMAAADGAGSCVYTADGVKICQDNITQDQCENGLGGVWSGVLTCEFRQNELENVLRPIGVSAAEVQPATLAPPTPRRRAPKPAKKKPAKKRATTHAAKRAPVAARTKPKKKAAPKAKRRPAKAAAKKKAKPAKKKAKRR
jgi:hypothetical protein